MIAEPLEKGLAEDIENEVVQITWNRYEQPGRAGIQPEVNNWGKRDCWDLQDAQYRAAASRQGSWFGFRASQSVSIPG